jgi:hypothetical protein
VDNIDLDQFRVWKSLIMSGMVATLGDQDMETLCRLLRFARTIPATEIFTAAEGMHERAVISLST